MIAPLGPGQPVDRRAIPAGAVEDAWIAPDGQHIRRLDWPSVRSAGQRRGSLLFLPGRGDFYEKWLDAIGHWHAQGWTITALDWRGQAGSGRLGDDPTTGHVSDYSVWIDDLAAFWRDWSAQAARPCVVVAHSMGGHISLRALAERRISPDALVLTAPMLGLLPQWLPRRVLNLFARIMVVLRGAKTPAWRGAERPDARGFERIALLTHDRDRYADENWWRRHRPDLSLGPPSWGWIERSFASMRELARPGALESVLTPVLVVASRHDGLVSWRAIRRAASRLPNARLLVYGEEARHEILREADPVRNTALAGIDAFFESAAPAR